MPAPVTHILLALSVLQNSHLAHHDKKQFIIGTSFPDIRYVVNIKRTVTHPNLVTWNDVIKEQSSFKAGMLFHVLVDQLHKAYIEERAVAKKYLNDLPNKDYALKFAEDAILYSKEKKDWYEISSFFDDIIEEEHAFGIEQEISQEILEKWHSYLKKYLNLHTWHARLKGFFFWKPILKWKLSAQFKNKKLSKKYLHAIIDNARALEKNKHIKKIVLDFYHTFEPDATFPPTHKTTSN